MHVIGTPFFQQQQALVMQNDERFARRFSAYLKVLPAQLTANPGSERFGDGFLGGKARRQERRGIAVRQAIGEFTVAEDPAHKAFAEAFIGTANAVDLDDIHAGAENHVTWG